MTATHTIPTNAVSALLAAEQEQAAALREWLAIEEAQRRAAAFLDARLGECRAEDFVL